MKRIEFLHMTCFIMLISLEAVGSGNKGYVYGMGTQVRLAYRECHNDKQSYKHMQFHASEPKVRSGLEQAIVRTSLSLSLS